MTEPMLSQSANLTSWAEHGLAGLVICALFGLVFFVLKGHRSERREWTVDATSREDIRVAQNETYIKVQVEFSEAVKELAKGQQESLEMHRQLHEENIRAKALRDAGMKGTT